MPIRCRVCTTVEQFDLIDLDTLMGDPSAWPSTLWGLFKPPSGDLPPSYRRFGAIEMGLAWAGQHNYPELRRIDMRRHYRFDVPKIATTPEALIETGLIAKDPSSSTTAGPPRFDPLRFLEYYDKGIELGVEGLKMLQERITTLQRGGHEVPLALIKMAVDAGSRLAMSQAAIRAAGRSIGGEDDVNEGFRAASAAPASPRMGHQRIRVIDGVATPVVDEGPADREHYSARAAQEGGEGLPHR